MKKFRGLIFLFALLLAAAITIIYLLPYWQKQKDINIEDRKSGLDMVEKNYGRSIDSCAGIFKIPAPYLKALTMLECGGRKVFEQRFEPHVYEKLKKVKSGELRNYEHITTDMLTDAGDDALRNLASSWGPFQLMGYKCTLMGINVKDIRGPESVYWGCKWIAMSYGRYLQEKDYKSAFHIHNTGIPYPVIGKPRTHDPEYVGRGLKYMTFFKTN